MDNSRFLIKAIQTWALKMNSLVLTQRDVKARKTSSNIVVIREAPTRETFVKSRFLFLNNLLEWKYLHITAIRRQ